MKNLSELLRRQRSYFASGVTRDYAFRRKQIQTLRTAIKENEDRVLEALAADMRKPRVEGFIGEVGFLYEEIGFTLKHLAGWMKPLKVPTPLLQVIASSRVYFEPRGNVLIIGPWNYPFQLAFAPTLSAMAAGNCIVLKPSELAPATSRIITELADKYFDPQYLAVVEGGQEASQALLAERFDHIFFTGSTRVGRVVMEAAAKHLTPVTLELGGKSPCIVHPSTDLELTARRIVWGKFFNAGQTCVAPDYLLCLPGTREPLLEKMRHYIEKFFGARPAESEDYGRIVSKRHFERLSSFLPEGRNAIGGEADEKQLYIAPTVKTDLAPDAKVMEDEIFGPILPVLEARDIEDAIAQINARPKPLALYLFTKDADAERKVLNEVSFGGGCVNDTLVHLSNPNLPFGGVGDSGIGAYHGHYGFETFSHRKSVVHKSFLIDPPLRYPPYGGRLGLLRKLLR